MLGHLFIKSKLKSVSGLTRVATIFRGFLSYIKTLAAFTKKSDSNVVLKCLKRYFWSLAPVFAFQIDYRQQVIKDLIEKEREFVAEVEALRENYLEPLRRSEMWVLFYPCWHCFMIDCSAAVHRKVANNLVLLSEITNALMHLKNPIKHKWLLLPRCLRKVWFSFLVILLPLLPIFAL